MLFTVDLVGQNTTQTDRIDSIWRHIQPNIKARAQLDNTELISALGSQKYASDSAKLATIEQLILKAEREFNLPFAVELGEYLIRLPMASKQPTFKARVLLDLHRYYDALGIKSKATICLEKAYSLNEQLGNVGELLRCKLYKIVDKRGYKSTDTVFAELNTLLKEAIELSDLRAIRAVQHYMLQTALAYDDLERAEFILSEMEQRAYGTLENTNDYYYLLSICRAHAELAQRKGNLVKEEEYLLKLVKLSRDEPDRWAEVNALQKLALLEWRKDNLAKSEDYADESLTKAKALNAYDLLAESYSIKAKLAKTKGQFKEAYNYLEEHYFFKDALEKRNNGFDLEKYYLQLEKDQLNAENERRQIEIAYQKSKTRSAIVITILVLLITIILFLSHSRYRKENTKVHEQNEIIGKQADKLKRAAEAKSQFLANVSHELRTPLTLLTAPINTLANADYLAARDKSLVQIAQQSGHQLTALVDEILDLRKSEQATLKLYEEPVYVLPFFRAHLAQFSSLANQKELDYVCEIELPEDLVSKIDQKKVRRILSNLITNAFKFTPAKGIVAVSISQTEQNIQIQVRDTGEGIHQQDIAHVFERYYQSATSKQSNVGGSGIGLALCHEYIQLMGGEIKVESTLGAGSVFTATLPIKQAQENEVDSLTRSASQNSEVYQPLKMDLAKTSKVAGDSILVVEDNPALQDFIALTLQERYLVYQAENGAEALEILEKHPTIKLIVSDLMMPVMDGYALAEAVKASAKTAHLPMVMLTARTEVESRLKALRLGIDDYMTKPFEQEELIVRIQNLLHHQAERLGASLDESLERKTTSAADAKWLDRFYDYILQNIDNLNLAVQDMAMEFGLSESTLLRKTKLLIGLTPTQYVLEIRLDFARNQLESGASKSIKTLAAQSGFKDTSTFSRNFKKRFGKSPSVY